MSFKSLAMVRHVLANPARSAGRYRCPHNRKTLPSLLRRIGKICGFGRMAKARRGVVAARRLPQSGSPTARIPMMDAFHLCVCQQRRQISPNRQRLPKCGPGVSRYLVSSQRLPATNLRRRKRSQPPPWRKRQASESEHLDYDCFPRGDRQSGVGPLRAARTAFLR